MFWKEGQMSTLWRCQHDKKWNRKPKNVQEGKLSFWWNTPKGKWPLERITKVPPRRWRNDACGWQRWRNYACDWRIWRNYVCGWQRWRNDACGFPGDDGMMRVVVQEMTELCVWLTEMTEWCVWLTEIMMRVVDVKTITGNYTIPINKVCRLEE